MTFDMDSEDEGRKVKKSSVKACTKDKSEAAPVVAEWSSSRTSMELHAAESSVVPQLDFVMDVSEPEDHIGVGIKEVVVSVARYY